MIEEECSDSNHPGESANISNNITMVLVEFSLKEETLVVLDEVHETRDGENSGDAHHTFVVLEWVGLQRGKLEVVVKNKEVAEVLVKQLSKTQHASPVSASKTSHRQ